MVNVTYCVNGEMYNENKNMEFKEYYYTRSSETEA